MGKFTPNQSRVKSNQKISFVLKNNLFCPAHKKGILLTILFAAASVKTRMSHTAIMLLENKKRWTEKTTPAYTAANQNLSDSYLFTRNYASEVEQCNFENPDLFCCSCTSLQYICCNTSQLNLVLYGLFTRSYSHKICFTWKSFISYVRTLRCSAA